jgi:hypothetical protein
MDRPFRLVMTTIAHDAKHLPTYVYMSRTRNSAGVPRVGEVLDLGADEIPETGASLPLKQLFRVTDVIRHFGRKSEELGVEIVTVKLACLHRESEGDYLLDTDLEQLGFTHS